MAASQVKAIKYNTIRYTIKFSYFPKVCYLFFGIYGFSIVYLKTTNPAFHPDSNPDGEPSRKVWA
jgi:hypothetical protein